MAKVKPYKEKIKAEDISTSPNLEHVSNAEAKYRLYYADIRLLQYIYRNLRKLSGYIGKDIKASRYKMIEYIVFYSDREKLILSLLISQAEKDNKLLLK